jgi:hypothetical protein
VQRSLQIHIEGVPSGRLVTFAKPLANDRYLAIAFEPRTRRSPPRPEPKSIAIRFRQVGGDFALRLYYVELAATLVAAAATGLSL